ncbi:FHA domain-containing protein [Amycolatopsis sp. EV170708-02-1]|uniref:FHA domain-containing protein n=1 Tax=Amycolatopsis sp. EV170708-02-1 TaxID=2919322 RepID=UPI001F0C2726|nr:FHA domain-containing protein [Amycolatopsis sp. EV170708-02-1]UMP01333.1 FHA domain-containing protein [Amycolatopsis sp. EV170708-02-1]
MTTFDRCHPSLAHGVPPAEPGTIFASTVSGRSSMPPKDGRQLLFGRNRDDVHVPLGEDDRQISRHQGTLVHEGGAWCVRNEGKLPLRLPGSRLVFGGDEPAPLSDGYTALFIRGSSGREHLLEIFVAGTDSPAPVSLGTEVTEPPRVWRLNTAERTVLVALAQRFLRREAYPQPLSWRRVADQLAKVDPDENWAPKKAEHIVTGVRQRLIDAGVPGLTKEEVGEPVGNALNVHLIGELLQSATLVPPDLALLEPRDRRP